MLIGHKLQVENVHASINTRFFGENDLRVREWNIRTQYILLVDIPEAITKRKLH